MSLNNINENISLFELLKKIKIKINQINNINNKIIYKK